MRDIERKERLSFLRDLPDVLAFLIVGVFVSLKTQDILSTSFPLVHDGGLYVRFIREIVASPLSGMASIVRNSAHPPLFFLAHVPFFLFDGFARGNNIVLLLNLIWWPAAAVLLYSLIRRVLRSGVAALLGLLLFTFSDLVAGQTFEFRQYLFLLAVELVVLHEFRSLSRGRGAERRFFVLGALLCLTHYSGALVMAALFCARPRRIAGYVLSVLPAALCLPWSRFFFTVEGQTYVPSLSGGAARTFERLGYLTDGMLLIPLGIPTILFALGTVRMLRDPERRPFGAATAAVLLIALAANFLGVYPLGERHAAYLLPFIFLAIPAAFQMIPSVQAARTATALACVLAVFFWMDPAVPPHRIAESYLFKVGQEVTRAADAVRSAGASSAMTSAVFATNPESDRFIRGVASVWTEPRIESTLESAVEAFQPAMDGDSCACFFDWNETVALYEKAGACASRAVNGWLGVCCNAACRPVSKPTGF